MSVALLAPSLSFSRKALVTASDPGCQTECSILVCGDVTLSGSLNSLTLDYCAGLRNGACNAYWAQIPLGDRVMVSLRLLISHEKFLMPVFTPSGQRSLAQK